MTHTVLSGVLRKFYQIPSLFSTLCLLQGKVKVLVTQLCLTLRPLDCSPPGSCVRRILQARILQWVAIFSSRESSWPRNRTQVSCIVGRFFTVWAKTHRITQKFICLNQQFSKVTQEHLYGPWDPFKGPRSPSFSQQIIYMKYLLTWF